MAYWHHGWIAELAYWAQAKAPGSEPLYEKTANICCWTVYSLQQLQKDAK